MTSRRHSSHLSGYILLETVVATGLLVAGLAVFIVVSLIAPALVSDPIKFSDAEWIGMRDGDVLYYFGPPEDVEEDGSGAAVLRYRKIILKEEHYVVEEMTVNVAADGRITDFKRE